MSLILLVIAIILIIIGLVLNRRLRRAELAAMAPVLTALGTPLTRWEASLRINAELAPYDGKIEVSNQAVTGMRTLSFGMIFGLLATGLTAINIQLNSWNNLTVVPTLLTVFLVLAVGSAAFSQKLYADLLAAQDRAYLKLTAATEPSALLATFMADSAVATRRTQLHQHRQVTWLLAVAIGLCIAAAWLSFS